MEAEAGSIPYVNWFVWDAVRFATKQYFVFGPLHHRSSSSPHAALQRLLSAEGREIDSVTMRLSA